MNVTYVISDSPILATDTNNVTIGIGKRWRPVCQTLTLPSQEFVDDWLANDMRVCIFKILLSWLIVSLIAIHFAWKVYGNTVNDMYYRQGTGQNGGTPETASHLSGWEGKAGDTLKTHRD
ncbi:hypothetical protein CesoFtcFv8_002492 [Champsocephalus esox]|uniref:T-cell leukemia translocation-altered gene protein homolog n=1 Tax=Champsocephalus esox TaxID=159716 RepID=A0AAN8HHM4_9TELE|nr:hypothetical protein CesoFtcFv8_002492 [Champsocephalus esox]